MINLFDLLNYISNFLINNAKLFLMTFVIYELVHRTKKYIKNHCKKPSKLAAMSECQSVMSQKYKCLFLLFILPRFSEKCVRISSALYTLYSKVL